MLPNINLLKVKKRSKLHHHWFQVAERLLHLLVIFGRSSGFDRKIFGIYCFRRIRHKFWSLYYRFNVMKPYIAGRDSSKQGCPWGESSVVVNRSFHSCVLSDRFFFLEILNAFSIIFTLTKLHLPSSQFILCKNSCSKVLVIALLD